MNKEEKFVKLRLRDGKLIEKILEINEEAPDLENMVLINLQIGLKELSFKKENHFQALEKLGDIWKEKNTNFAMVQH
ncbi:hypothetical protein [Cytobacillus firmus]|uniref:hypothetical protein n=1 Tax=Cytobacillus firmus TaxID=1399 RepID=UPI0018CE8A73|nr:hypothetical protein [Cytobacillus firmus]MBG9587694.1 hypothetical protein [Cytobacillus firmus]